MICMYICTYSTYCSIASSPTSLYLLLCTPFSILLKKIFITVKKTRVFLCQVKMIMKIREIVLKHPSESRSTFFFSWEMAQHSLIRGVLIQSCSTGAKNFTNYVFYHPQFSSVPKNIESCCAIRTKFWKIVFLTL